MGTKFCVTGTVTEELLSLFILIKEGGEVADNGGLFLAHIPAPPLPTRSWQSLILSAPGATNEKMEGQTPGWLPAVAKTRVEALSVLPAPSYPRIAA